MGHRSCASIQPAVITAASSREARRKRSHIYKYIYIYNNTSDHVKPRTMRTTLLYCNANAALLLLQRECRATAAALLQREMPRYTVILQRECRVMVVIVTVWYRSRSSSRNSGENLNNAPRPRKNPIDPPLEHPARRPLRSPLTLYCNAKCHATLYHFTAT